MTGPFLSWAATACALWTAAWLESHPVALFIVLWCAGCGAVLAAYFWATRTGYYERQERRYTPRHAPAPATSPRGWPMARVRSRHPEAEAGGRETAGGESRAGSMAPVPAVPRPQGWPGTTPPMSVPGAAGQPGEDMGQRAGLTGRGSVTLPRVAAPGTTPPGWTNRQPWATAPLPVVPDRAMAGA